MDFNLDIIKKFSPALHFDKLEPFFPIRVGVSLYEKTSLSNSFPRTIKIGEDTAFAIEYAIYWDYDIGHLYELEHAWVYVGKDGSLQDAEASFHGGYMKSILPPRDNILEETHVALYSQPGKHAFLPRAELLHLIHNLMQAPSVDAGDSGLIQTKAFEGCYEMSAERDRLATKYLKTCAFIPSMEFVRWQFPDDCFIPWEQLKEEIPLRIDAEIERLKKL